MLTDRLDQIESRYKEITAKMSDPAVTSDIKQVTELSKEFSGFSLGSISSFFSPGMTKGFLHPLKISLTVN